MIRSTLFLAIAAFAFSAMDASAAEIKVAYKGVVTQANGAQASSFAPGQTITLHYVVETNTPDNNPDTSKGVYFNGLREMKISIAAAGVDVTAGIGTVQTFNDIGSDQAFFYSTGTSGELAGLPVTFAEVDFVDYEVGTNGQSAMLASDAIPTAHLLVTDNSLSFGTSAGYTSVRFLAEPEITCASEGYTGTKLTWCQNICEKGYTGSTLNMWIRRWIDRYRTLPACAAAQPEN